MLQAFLQGALEVVFPDNCFLCRRFLNSGHQRQLCDGCRNRLVLNPTPFHRDQAGGSFAFDQAWSVCVFNETAQKLLHDFKYNGKTSLRKTFVPLMTDFIDRHQIPLREFDLISPVPLHPVKWRERGYNQSALLSLGLCQHYSLAHAEKVLVRRKRTRTQTELRAKERWTNMQGAFKIKNSADLNGKSVMLVDDLLTTGATLSWAAQALKEGGALRVGALTLCTA